MKGKIDNLELIKTYKLKRTDYPDLKFQGILLGSVEGSIVSYIGKNISEYIFTLYETIADRFICHKVCTTSYDITTYTAKYTKTNAGIIDFFGQSNLAHDLYDSVDIDNSELIQE